MRRFFQIFCFVLITLLFFQAEAKENAVNIFQASRDVPLRKIKHENGTTYNLKDFNGQFVVAVFWSKSCGPCIKELEGLNTFYKNAKPENIRLILISKDSEWHSAVEQRLFLKKYKAPDVEFYTDLKGDLAGDFGIFTSPHTVLINENSQEIGRINGRAKWGDPRVLDYIKKIREENKNSDSISEPK